VRPSPRAMVVEAKNSARSTSENCRSRPYQALLGSIRLNQSQRRRRAMPALSRFRTPRPMGRQTRPQFTWQLPPWASLRPAPQPRGSLAVSFR
jgi:hypothetical protein